MQKLLLLALCLMAGAPAWSQDFHIMPGSCRVSYDPTTTTLCCTYSVRNSGAGTTRPVVVGFALAPGNNSGSPAGADPNAPMYLVGYDTLRGFAAEDTIYNRQHFTRLANFCNIPAGNYVVLVLLDHPNAFAEIDEFYNRIRLGDVAHTCQPGPPPPTHPTQPDVLFEPQSGLLSHDPATGELIFTTAIRNSGASTSQPFQVAYVLAVSLSFGAQHYVLGIDSLPGIASGSVVQNLSFRGKLSDHCNIPPGTYRFMVMPDYGNQLAEPNEINNFAGFSTVEVRPCTR